MKTNRTIFLVLYFITHVLGDGGPAPTEAAAVGERTVIVFGDDLAAGVGATTNGLVEWLHLQTGLSVLNAGRAGDRAELALGRLEQDVLSKSPAVVVVLLGGSDILQKRYLYETRSDIFDIVERIQDAGAATIVVSLYSGMDQAHQDIYRDLYSQTDSAFVPNILDGLSNPYTGTSFPGDQDYRVMALRISPLVSAIVKGEVKAPVLTLNSAGTPVDPKVTIQWHGESGVAYDVLAGDAGSSVSQMNVVASIKGTAGETQVTLNASSKNRVFAVRAFRQ